MTYPFGAAQAAGQAPKVVAVPAVDQTAVAAVVTDGGLNIATTVLTNAHVTVVDSQYMIERARQKQEAKTKKQAQVKAIAVNANADVSPQEKQAWVQKAASATNIDWRLLSAVWQVESGQRWQSAIANRSGAQGPCQFMKGTWNHYATDGNGDGVKSITDARDCLFGAAKLLAANGASSGDETRALLSYNHSTSYANKVKSLAASK